jgi:WD40 repeat protein
MDDRDTLYYPEVPMIGRLRQLPAAIAFVLMIACGAVPAGVAPPATSVSLAAPPTMTTSTAAPVTTALPATIAPAAAPTAAPVATALPATIAPVAAPIPPPTATPAFPESRITEATLSALQPLRSIGFGAAHDAAIDPDSRLLAVATTAGVALFELPELRHLRFDPISGGANHVSFSDNGETLTLIVGSPFEPQETQVRRVADGMLLSSGPAEATAKPLTVLSADGRLQAQFNVPDSSPTPGVRLVRVADAQLIYEDALSERVAFSPDGSLLALVAYDGTLRLLDPNGATVRTLELPAYWSIAFSPDGKSIVTAGRGAWMWDAVSGQLREQLAGLALADDSWVTSAVQRARFSPDGAILTVAGEYSGFEATAHRGSAWTIGDAGAVHAWDSDAGGAGIMNFTTYKGAISPATEAVAWTDDGVALGVKPRAGAEYTLQVPQGVGALAFSADGQLLAVGDKAGLVRLVRTSDGSIVRSVQAGAALAVLQFSPNGALVGGRGMDGRLLVWEVADGALVGRMAAEPAEAASPPDMSGRDPFIFTPDGTLLITWGIGGVRFYRISDWRLVHQIAETVEDVAIGPRQRLLSLVHGGRVELWGIP